LLFHDLRRSAVRNMIRSGVPQSVAMKITGHRTVAVFNRYDITAADDITAALEKTAKYRAG
jgi:Phage integrase family